MREPAQRFVANCVAEGVVDVLQRIDVDHHHRDALIVARRARERDADAVVEDRPSRQSGQLVVHVHRAPGAGVVELASVSDQTGDLAARTETSDDRHHNRHDVAAPGEKRDLSVPVAGAQQLGPDLFVVLREHLRREHVGGREVGGVAEPETLASRLVQVLDATLLVDDADEIRSCLDEREQLPGDVPVRSDLTHVRVSQIASCGGRPFAQLGTVEL